MTTVDFNTLIYTASKSLKNTEGEISPEVHGHLNSMLQDKMLHVVQNKEVFKRDLSIKFWLFKVLNKTFQLQPEVSIAVGVNSSELKAQFPASTELNEIHHAVNKMEEYLMIPFIMHFQGFKFEEIAADLNLPVETIKNRIESARMFLINEISE
jgi:DNA-directed RNA polymerase specialized sigma24 family protein